MSESPPRVELYLRSLAPTTSRSQQEQVVSRLQQLDQAGAIADFEVALCGDCVCPSAATAETDIGSRLLEQYETFREWADERDRDLVGFETHDTKSMLTGQTVTGIAFPKITLAEYRDGDLTFVAPSGNGTETTSVTDRIDIY